LTVVEGWLEGIWILSGALEFWSRVG